MSSCERERVVGIEGVEPSCSSHVINALPACNASLFVGLIAVVLALVCVRM